MAAFHNNLCAILPNTEGWHRGYIFTLRKCRQTATRKPAARGFSYAYCDGCNGIGRGFATSTHMRARVKCYGMLRFVKVFCEIRACEGNGRDVKQRMKKEILNPGTRGVDILNGNSEGVGGNSRTSTRMRAIPC